MEMEASQHIIFKDRLDKAIRLSYGVIKSMYETPIDFNLDGMFVIWYCKTLQNWKAILSANFDGAPLVEVTYSGDKQDTNIDVYKKIESVRIPD